MQWIQKENIMAKLNINRGTTYTINFEYKKNDVATSLVGSTIRFTMKSAEFTSDMNDTDAIIQKDVTNGDELGHAEIIINPADTKELLPGKYYYDIKVDALSDGTEVYKVSEGTIKLDGSPTNRLA